MAANRNRWAAPDPPSRRGKRVPPSSAPRDATSGSEVPSKKPRESAWRRLRSAIALRRIRSGPFLIERAMSLEEVSERGADTLADERFLGLNDLPLALPAIELPESKVELFLAGRAIPTTERFACDTLAVRDTTGSLLGIAAREPRSEGDWLHPKVVVRSPSVGTGP